MYSLTGVYILNKAKAIANFGNFGDSKDCCLMGIKHKKRGNYPQKRTKTHKRNSYYLVPTCKQVGTQKIYQKLKCLKSISFE